MIFNKKILIPKEAKLQTGGLGPKEAQSRERRIQEIKDIFAGEKG